MRSDRFISFALNSGEVTYIFSLFVSKHRHDAKLAMTKQQGMTIIANGESLRQIIHRNEVNILYGIDSNVQINTFVNRN